MKKLKEILGKTTALTLTIGMMSISLITPSYAGQMNSSKDLPYERNMHTGSNYSSQVLRDESTNISDELVNENSVDENSESQNPNQEISAQEKSVEFSNNADSSDLEEFDINSKEQVENTIQEKPDFIDISETDWFYADVMELAGMGIIAGYPSGEFAATDYITSEQFIKMIVVAMKYPLSDLDNKWYEKYTDVLYAKGITSDNFIKYEQAVTREQIARLVARTLRHEGMINDRGKDTLIRNAISDFNKISSGYEQDILDSYYFGIMQGNEYKVINPQGKLTRAEASSIILRMIKEDRRLVLDLVDNSTFQITNYDGTMSDILNIPYYNGVLQREMADVINILIESSNKSKGWEDWGMSAKNDKVRDSHNVFESNYCETEDKLKYINKEKTTPEEWDDYFALLPWKVDATTYINFDDFDKITRGTAPYNFSVYKNLAETEQEKYDHNYEMYKEYFLEYYKEMYVDAFKYLFEDDFDEVWELFCTALENDYDGYTKNQGLSEDDHVEGWYIFNDRQVFINYNANYVSLYVSLKGVRYEK